jgi:hypothetical protein
VLATTKFIVGFFSESGPKWCPVYEEMSVIGH